MPKNIIIIADDIQSLGGVQQFANILSKGFAQRGNRVSLIAICNNGDPVAYERHADVTTDEIFERPYSHYAKRAELATQTGASEDEIWQQHRKMANEGNAKLKTYVGSWDAHSILIVLQLSSMIALRNAGIHRRKHDRPKLIAQYHNSYDYAVSVGYISEIIQEYSLADKALFLTAGDALCFASAGIQGASYVHNPVDVKIRNSIKATRNKTVVSMSRLHKDKSIDELLSAWAMVAETFPDWSLNVYGEGPERENLVTLADRLGISNSVLFKGTTNNVLDVFETASINVLTSHREGWGLVIAEAASCGIPTVAYDGGYGVRELIADERTGLLVRTNRPEHFAQALSKLMSSSDYRNQLGRKAESEIRKYSLDNVINKWETIIYRLN
ncbi:glycosyltransferase [Arthrobacter sp. AET 35A]|uniref:glycosyltransferase n=1 Tax=Arthrobacter sp. AET 35A TaxID=2292643 RepID=UPI00177E5BBC|nr:glycosyltransferase [Arthrobacter sp. AET 35A]